MAHVKNFLAHRKISIRKKIESLFEYILWSQFYERSEQNILWCVFFSGRVGDPYNCGPPNKRSSYAIGIDRYNENPFFIFRSTL